MKRKKDWWKSAVFYQIYPKSFCDANGDGIGDLNGICEKLDYLKWLGIDGIWLSPVMQSPQADNGYDISDYQNIDPMFGTMEDMEKLISMAKEREIAIIMDLVLNHSSDEHVWFKEALKGKDNPYHDYYIWRDGTPDQLPNDMKAAFGGSAWTYVPELQQYYFHQFAVKQPDLNWENPKVRNELYQMIRFWMDKGIEGFRLDVIDQIGKVPDLKISGNGPKLHEYIKELSRETFQKGENIVTVGEAWSADVECAKEYSDPSGSELSMIFQFEHICLDQKPDGSKWEIIPLPLTKLKKCYESWQNGLHGKGWNSLFLNNHDLPRTVSRWGNDGIYREVSAKMLAVMIHGMEGTPYIYQGEELGMCNPRLSMKDWQDIESINFYQEGIERGENPEDLIEAVHKRGRDNARTPMQWNDGKNAGFTDGHPWMPVDEAHKEINAEAEMKDQNSVLHFYKELITLRKQYQIFENGDFTLLDPDNEKVFTYVRENDKEQLLVVCSFSERDEAWKLPESMKNSVKLIGNYDDLHDGLKPYETAMYYLSKEG